MSPVNLESLSGEEFFKEIEIRIKTKIPQCLRLILIHRDIDTASIFSKLNDECIAEIEEFVRTELEEAMIPDQRALDDYLGTYRKCQAKFKFSSGQRIILKLISDACANVLSNDDKGSNFCIENSNTTSASSTEGSSQLMRTMERIEKPSTNTKEFNLFNYIGSLMITIFNDAKRLTLSAWSWPSRHVATEKANHFRATGDSECTPTLYYVTPTQHRTFLDCIVNSNKADFVHSLKNAWAMSLRVDGSVDRTQDHNIYVLGNIVNNDATMSTVFIGFQIPKKGKSLGYFECVESVVNNIWKWEELLALVTSLVTDGEALNSGSEQGLWIRFEKEVRKSNSRKQPIISIWCVPHRFNLAWKDVCSDCPMIAEIIALASSLSSYFHKSGARTEKLRNVATANNLQKPLRYISHFEVRWTEFVSLLLTVTLRNWRSSMAYFESENETGLSNRWRLYDRLHFLTFITDILNLLKKFQKTFESDTISILNIQGKKQELFNALHLASDTPVCNGWEEFFLANVEIKNDGKYFYGHKLITNIIRSTRTPTFVFDVSKRQSIIQSILIRLSQRLDYDLQLQQDLSPLLEIRDSVSDESLKSCFNTIAPDYDEATFYQEYKVAAGLLEGYEFINPLQTLQKLHCLMPNNIHVLKIALARTAAAKPHSADVEQLINSYNKLKSTDRTALSGLTLFNYLYANVNMSTVDEFDPSPAVQLWMAQKNRLPHESSKRKEQEWFKNTFKEADVKKNSHNDPIISF